MKVTERQGVKNDGMWLWDIYVDLLKKPIAEQWGWDVEFQKNYFKTELESVRFKIVSVNGIDVAAYLINEETDHYYLKMLLVIEQYQKRGIGHKLIKKLKVKANKTNKSIRLSVIKANPVLGFYEKLGFLVVGEEGGSIKLEL